jgi:benzodiazapine receptor
MDNRFYQVANVVAVIGTLIMNSLANILPFNGVTTGQVSDSYPNLFTPPGYVFAIWGVIYTLAAVFMIYQARPSQTGKKYLAQIGIWYFVSGVINSVWLFLFHYSYGAPTIFLISVVDIVLLLIVLILVYTRLGIGRSNVSISEKLGVHIHFSVYLGWICLATIAAVASALNLIFPNMPSFTQEVGAAVMIAIALALTITMLVRRRDFAFAMVVIWASVGIAVKNIQSPIIFYTAVATATIIALALIAIPVIKKKGILEF